eukprot:2729714-Rhodomonas_salina.1
MDFWELCSSRVSGGVFGSSLSLSLTARRAQPPSKRALDVFKDETLHRSGQALCRMADGKKRRQQRRSSVTVVAFSNTIHLENAFESLCKELGTETIEIRYPRVETSVKVVPCG